MLKRRPDLIPRLPSPHTPQTSLANSSESASAQSKIGTPIVFLVSRMPSASAVRLQVSRGQIPLQPLDHEVLLSTRSAEEDESDLNK